LSKEKDKKRDVQEDKEKLSRVSKRHRKEARKKRRVVLIIVLLVGAVLAVGAAFNIPYINVAREAGSWLGEKFSGSDTGEVAKEDYLFFTNPETGRESVGQVSVLAGIYRTEEGGEGKRVILGLALLTYDTNEGSGEVYLIPESSVAYNAAGEQTQLRYALQEEGGLDLIRSTVGNLAGDEVDYVAFFDYWQALKLIQGLDFPPTELVEETVLVNPINGETNFLAAGQEISDADRLLFYLLATDELDIWEAFSKRLERVRVYLPELLYGIDQESTEQLESMLSSLADGYLLEPGTGSVDGDRRYLASMLQAYAGLEEAELAIRAVPPVEVLNGCGVPDLGKRVGDKLASLGVPVAGTAGNAKVIVDGEEVNDFTHEASTIIYRSEDTRVEAFARYLSVLMSIEDVSLEPGPGAEIVIIAGKDQAV
jgi:hypothetical protein